MAHNTMNSGKYAIGWLQLKFLWLRLAYIVSSIAHTIQAAGTHGKKKKRFLIVVKFMHEIKTINRKLFCYIYMHWCLHAHKMYVRKLCDAKYLAFFISWIEKHCLKRRAQMHSENCKQKCRICIFEALTAVNKALNCTLSSEMSAQSSLTKGHALESPFPLWKTTCIGLNGMGEQHTLG